jgi:cardiolipin synthase (CMP-forming)
MPDEEPEPTAGSAAPEVSDRILTVPNALSFLRVLLVPVFFWLVMVPEADELALGVLVVSGVTDWLDGRLARALGQTSRLGQVLDPVADRLFTIVTVIALVLRGIVPWWLLVVLLARDVVMLIVQLWVHRRGAPVIPVNLVGKAATVCLLWAMPLLLITDGTGWVAEVVRPFAWAFTVWGIGLYWWSAVLYLAQARAVVTGRALQLRV